MKQALCLTLLLGLAGGAAAGSYAEMKAGMGPDPSPTLSYLATSNGQVEVHVAELGTDNAGRFTIGTGTGEYLLYGHEWDPWSTYVRIRIDGIVYAPEGGGNYDVAMLPSFGPALVGSTITTSWQAEGILIVQNLTPVVIDGQGTVEIEYAVTNLGNTERDVSVMLEMDTMVNWNDAAPISTSNGYVDVETCYSGSMVPNTWQAFEEGPNQDPSLLVGCGILNGHGATLPHFAAFGAWGSVYSGPFDYVCSGLQYWDSGCLLRWNAGYLNPGAGVTYRTYYGTCTTITQPGELALNLGGTASLSCVDGVLTPNPFDVNLLVTNTGGETCHDVIATITPGPGLTGGDPVWIGDLEPGQVGAASFFLTVADNYCDSYGYFLVEVSSADCEGNGIGREIWIPCCEQEPVGADEQPLAFTLDAACPNPFNPATTISFTMMETGPATLTVFNLAGAPVATLWQGMAERGRHTVVFDAAALPSGVYFYSLGTSQGVQTRKMLLTK
ncbi:MAG: T9SS type A sorting domain-containing protein [bacterium]|jgi:hypothetical protein|nr:T9SS type A sorting domain-containing protein [bacterium]